MCRLNTKSTYVSRYYVVPYLHSIKLVRREITTRKKIITKSDVVTMFFIDIGRYI